jgi:hypothetical protein
MFPPPRTALPYALAFLASLILTCTVLVGSAHAARSVSLRDASRPPTYMAYVDVDHTATPYAARVHGGKPCKYADGTRGYYSDVSVYTWTGGAMGAQRWDASWSRYTWQERGRSRGYRASYDGLTFYNGTSRPVIVAAWCERG